MNHDHDHSTTKKIKNKRRRNKTSERARARVRDDESRSLHLLALRNEAPLQEHVAHVRLGGDQRAEHLLQRVGETLARKNIRTPCTKTGMTGCGDGRIRREKIQQRRSGSIDLRVEGCGIVRQHIRMQCAVIDSDCLVQITNKHTTHNTHDTQTNTVLPPRT